MLVDIVEARPIGAYVLQIRFADGVEGEVDLDRILLWKGVFEVLRDPVRFAEVRVDPELGTIVWPNGARTLCTPR